MNNELSKKESHVRSILKSLTWRLIASFTTFVLAYTIFSQTDCPDVLAKSSIVAGLEFFLKIIIYYFHERAWLLAPKGSIRKLFKTRNPKS